MNANPPCCAVPAFASLVAGSRGPPGFVRLAHEAVYPKFCKTAIKPPIAVLQNQKRMCRKGRDIDKLGIRRFECPICKSSDISYYRIVEMQAASSFAVKVEQSAKLPGEKGIA
ncbi:MAG: hypothetical protein LBT97_09260 [Planctomycetota bacterium]|jgi:hypothetical protein|nr:hypothetical protein [Planctomycetota bacterium]